MLSHRAAGVLIALTIPVIVALLTLRPDPFSQRQTVRVIFDEAKGIAKVERDVRIRGVNAGRIGAVRRVGDDAEVTLELDQGSGEIYADATARLRPHSVFEGSAFVDLDPGTPAAGPLKGAVIVRENSDVFVSLDQSLRGLDRPRREALQRIAGELSAATTQGATDASRRVLSAAPQLLEDSSDAIDAIRGPRGTELSSAVRDMAGVASAVASEADGLASTARDTAATLDAIGGGDGQAIDRTLDQLPATLAAVRDGAAGATEVSRLARSAARDADGALRRTGPVLRKLDPTLTRAPKALRDAPDLLDDMRLMIADIDRAAVPLKQLLEPVQKAVDDLGNRALPAVSAPSRLGRPAYEQFLAAGSGLTGALSHYQTPEQNPFGAGRFVKLGGDVVNGLLGMRLDPEIRGTTP